MSILLGVLAGLGAILFHSLLEEMRCLFEPQYFSGTFPLPSYFIVAVPVVGAVICATMTRLFPVVARERGVISVIRSIIINKGFIPLRVALFHLIAPIVCIGSGAPLGPEGPAAKVGSGMGSLMSQAFRLNRKDMMMYTAAGGGAAIAAVFNAPIAGVFFGIEVLLLNDLKNRALSALIISCVVADILSRSILGSKQIFSIPEYSLQTAGNFHFYLLLGVLCGLLSLVYFRIDRSMGRLINERLHITNEYMKLVPVALIFGLILLKYYQLFGIGYSTINEVLNNRISPNDIFMLLVLKILFLALYLNAGGYGGTFAPSLSIGAFFGYIFSVSMNLLFGTALDPIAFSLAGMGGVLAGINSIPLTAIMLVFEVTSDYRFILPLMLVSIISYLVIIYFNRGSVYTNSLKESGIDVSKRGEVDLLGKIRVQELMKTEYDLVNHHMPFRKLLDFIRDAKHGDMFVVDDNIRLVGMISLKHVRQALLDRDLIDLMIARDLAIPVPTISGKDPVSQALKKIEMYDIETIPVTSGGDMNIIGVLTHQDIIQAYNRLLNEWETDQFIVNY